MRLQETRCRNAPQCYTGHWEPSPRYGELVGIEFPDLTYLDLKKPNCCDKLFKLWEIEDENGVAILTGGIHLRHNP